MHNEKNNIFLLIQKFLQNPPLIVWGSGATVSYGLPTMGKLNEDIGRSISVFNKNNDNLELELSKEEYNEIMPKIKNVIWDSVNNANLSAMRSLIENNGHSFEAIKDMIVKFKKAHPKVVNIVTTNYDCILENVMSYYELKFTDGFNGREFCKLDMAAFKDNDMINLVKVHGSLKWFFVNDEVRYLSNSINDTKIAIIAPSKNKYQECYKTPYRELIQKSDEYIRNANSFLVVGFGFNDEHLTPKIKEKVRNGTPLVLITKSVTDSTHRELMQAEKYILLEEDISNTNNTKITYKNNDEPKIIIIAGNYWSLNSFINEVL